MLKWMGKIFGGSPATPAAVARDPFSALGEEYIASTVTPMDQSGSRWRDRRTHEQYVARYVSWVAICCRKNATVCAAQKLRLYSVGKKRPGKKVMPMQAARVKDMGGIAAGMMGDDAVEITEHPVLDLLNKPSPFYTSSDAKYLRFLSKDMCGNSYALIDVDDSDGSLMMIPLLPQYVAPIMDNRNFITGYRYGREEAIARDYPRGQVFHAMSAPSGITPYEGGPPSFDVLMEADLIMASTQAETSKYRNNNLPPVHVDIAPETTDDQAKTLLESIKRQMKGVRNAGEWLLTRGAKVTMMGFPNRDIEMAKGLEVFTKRIWAAYDIPESVMMPNQGSLAAASVGDPAWMRYGILPRLQRDADDLTNRLLPMFAEDTSGLFFAYDNPVKEDEEARARVRGQLVRDGIIKPEVAAIELGYEETDTPEPLAITAAPQNTGKDQPADPNAKPATNTKTADVSNVEASLTGMNGAQVTAISGLASQVANGDLPMETAIAIARAAFPMLDETLIAGIFNPLKNFEPPQPEPSGQAPEAPPQTEKHRTRRLVLGKSTAAAEESLKSQVQAWLERVAGSGITQVTPQLQAELSTILQAEFRQGFSQFAKEAGVNNFVRAAEEYALERTPLVLDSITQTTNDKLSLIIARSAETGDLRQAVTEIMGQGESENRAALIARTETANQQNAANIIHLEEAGLYKSWDASGHACPLCHAAQAQIARKFPGGAVPPSEPFLQVGEMVNYTDESGVSRAFVAPFPIYNAPLHPNCTCSNPGVPKP